MTENLAALSILNSVASHGAGKEVAAVIERATSSCASHSSDYVSYTCKDIHVLGGTHSLLLLLLLL